MENEPVAENRSQKTVSVQHSHGLECLGIEDNVLAIDISLEEILNDNSMLPVQSQDKKIVSRFYVKCFNELWRLCENIFSHDSLMATSLILIKEYPHFKPQEIILILRNGLGGSYGKLYGKISTATIMEWFWRYEHQRLNFIESEHRKIKANGTGLRDYHPKVLDLMKKIISEEKPKKEKTEIQKLQDEHNKMIQDWLKEFDKIKKGRFADYEGKMINVDEFLTMKYSLHSNKIL